MTARVTKPLPTDTSLQQQIQQQQTFTDSLEQIADLSLAASTPEMLLQAVVQPLGEALQVDRCLVYQVDLDRRQLTQQGKWLRSDAITLAIPDATHLDAIVALGQHSPPHEWLESHWDDINPDFGHQESTALLHEQTQIQSLLWYPLNLSAHGYYLFVFEQSHDRHRWHGPETTFLKTAIKQIRLALLLHHTQIALSQATQLPVARDSTAERLTELQQTIDRLESEATAHQVIRAERERAEAALQKSQERFTLAVSETYDGIWDWDLKTNKVFFSPVWFATLGYSEDELPQDFSTWSDRVHSHDLSLAQQAIQDHLAGQTPLYHCVFRMQHKQGHWLWIEARGKCARDESGQPYRLTGTQRDISDRRQSEEKLLRISTAIENTSDAIGIVDAVGAVDYVNPAFIQLFGYSLEQLAAIGGIAALYKDPQVIDPITFAVQSGGSWIGEIEMLTQDGQQLYILLRANAIKDRCEQIVGWVGVHTDITDHKQAEQSLRESEERFRLVSEAIPLPILISRVSDGQVMYVNESLSTTFGIPAAQALGYAVPNFYYDIRDRARLISELQQQGFVRNFEIQVLKADRTPFWVMISAKFLSLNGELAILSAFYDLTERKQSEEALHQSEARFRGFVENANDIIYSITPDGIFSYVSPNWTTLLGHEISEIEGRPFPQLIYPDDLPMCVDVFTQLMTSGGNHAGIEYRIWHKDGSLRWHTSNVSVFTNEHGTIQYLIGIARDITDRKQAEEQLRQQAAQLEQTLRDLQKTQSQLIQTEKMSSLGQLVAGVAHEINNPVNFIHGNLSHTTTYTESLLDLLDLYRQHYPDPVPEIQAQVEDLDLEFLMTDLPKTLTSMRMGTDRIRQIVLSLRNFSRLDEAEMKPVDIHAGIDSTLLILQNRLKPQSDRPGIQVIQHYGDLPLVACYAGQLNQVFMNIIGNAIDALEESISKGRWALPDKREPPQDGNLPTITIRTQVIDDRQQVAICIADNGPGITAEVSKRLFDPFFTTKPVGQGTGLGLSISYQIIVEKHRGTLRCESTPGQGTEFWIEIPV